MIEEAIRPAKAFDWHCSLISLVLSHDMLCNSDSFSIHCSQNEPPKYTKRISRRRPQYHIEASGDIQINPNKEDYTAALLTSRRMYVHGDGENSHRAEPRLTPAFVGRPTKRGLGIPQSCHDTPFHFLDSSFHFPAPVSISIPISKWITQVCSTSRYASTPLRRPH